MKEGRKWKRVRELNFRDLDSINAQDIEQLYVFKQSLELHGAAHGLRARSTLFSLPGKGSDVRAPGPITFVPRCPWSPKPHPAPGHPPAISQTGPSAHILVKPDSMLHAAIKH